MNKEKIIGALESLKKNISQNPSRPFSIQEIILMVEIIENDIKRYLEE